MYIYMYLYMYNIYIWNENKDLWKNNQMNEYTGMKNENTQLLLSNYDGASEQ